MIPWTLNSPHTLIGWFACLFFSQLYTHYLYSCNAVHLLWTHLVVLNSCVCVACPAHWVLCLFDSGQKKGLFFRDREKHTDLQLSRMQIASMTVMTRSGGLVNTLISEMSALSRELRAWLAPSRAGRASSRSFWASAAIAWVSSALTSAKASSSFTTLRTCGYILYHVHTTQH